MERKELTLVEPENGNGGMLSVPQQQKAALVNASALAQDVAKIVRDNGLSKAFKAGAKEHVFVEGWLTISRVNNEAPHAKIEATETHGDFEVIKARAWITDAHGVVVSEADGYCSTEEKNWSDKPFYARASMAQTRAIGKAMRLRHAWVMVMAGFSPTPAEEMDGLDAAPAPAAPAKAKKVYVMPKESKEGDDAENVPASVTDAAEPIVVPDDGMETFVLKAYTKEKTDKKGQKYHSLLLVAADNSEDWYYCNHADSISLLSPSLKEHAVMAKVEDKGGFKLCHKLQVIA